MKYHNQDVVPKNVQNAADGQAEHGVKGLPFIAETVVENQRANDKGGRQKYPEAVVHGVGENGLGAPQKAHQRFQENEPQSCKAHACGASQVEGAGSIFTGSVCIFGCQTPGDKCAAAVAQHKGYALHNGLDGKQHPRCRLRAGSQSTHKIGVRHVVNVRDEHGNGGGDAKVENQL